MCGIVGVLCLNDKVSVNEKLLLQMRDTMFHRGPDGSGSYISDDRKIGLAHRRLSIVDLSKVASQPMPNENYTIWVTFNGEIYNHLVLRKELQKAGHKFRTISSDTEVIIHGYEEWGIQGLVNRMEGDWAIGLWDSNKQRLFLIRDRVGVKPIYFSLQEDIFLFASEIKAIVVHPSVSRDIDPNAMYHYLSFLTTPAPLTMFKGIFKLPAGYCLEVDNNGKFHSWQYWDALPGKSNISESTKGLNSYDKEKFYINGIRDRLERAVEKRMMSDVPLGVFLSGGIDSSTNVALMSRSMSNPVDTFTVGFKDHQHLNELQYAELISKKFKTNHHEILIDQNDMMGFLDTLVYQQDEPIADWVCIPLHFVSKLAKEMGETVIQVGEGADEQFCGYAGYMAYLKLYKKYWRPYRGITPKIIQHLFSNVARWGAGKNPSLQVYADIIDRASKNREHFWTGAVSFWETMKTPLIQPGSILPSVIPKALANSGLFSELFLKADSFNIIDSFYKGIDTLHPNQDILTRMIYSEFKLRLPELLLMRVDKITMGNSLEARVPFLDHELIEFSMDIPMLDKVRGDIPKYLLKEAVRGIIPDEIIDRKKMGFGAPMSQWLRGYFGQQVEKKVTSSNLMKRGFFNKDYILKLFHDHFANKNDNGLYLWTIYNLTAWYDYWIDRKYN